MRHGRKGAIASSGFIFHNVDFVADFGGVGDGSTANTSPWLTFGGFFNGISNRYHVTLTVPAGTYNFFAAGCITSLFGIPYLAIIGTGSPSFENTDTTAGTPPWMPASFSNVREVNAALIDTTAIGDDQVQLKTPADHSKYAVGNSILIGSEDIQISSSNSSYPPNINKFDFATVISKNTGAGIIRFTPPLTNIHRDDNIDGPSGGSITQCGKARIWLMDGTQSGVPFVWETHHIYSGLEFGVAPNVGTPYIGMVGRYQLWENCVMGGASPQMADRIEIIGGETYDINEPDKIVKSLLIDGTWLKMGMIFQSSSIDDVDVRNCDIDSFFSSGLAKRVVLTNNTIEQFGTGIAGTAYGHNLSTTINGGTIDDWTYRGEFASGTLLEIDGVDITYASDVITLPKTTVELASWNMVPNVSKINLSAGGASRYFTGDLGTASVTSLTEDSTNIYIHVSGWPASLPAYSDGKIRISRHGPVYFNEVTGCPEVVNASAATALGKFYWQYLNTNIDGDAAASGHWNDGSGHGYVGNLISIIVNVTRASTAGGVRWQLHSNGMVDASTMASSVPFDIFIDATVTGIRTFTQSALTGKTGTDDVLLNAVTQSTLPAGKWLQQTFGWAYDGGSGANSLITVTFEYDTGTEFRSAA